MTRGTEVTIAGKRYANAAAYIQAILGSMKTMANGDDEEPLAVTIRPTKELDPDEAKALA